MKIRRMSIASSINERIELIFKQLGCKKINHHGQAVSSIITTPEVMHEKVEIALEQLKPLGYNRVSNSEKHFWYISDSRKKLDTITIEAQAEGFSKERQEFLIYW